MVRWALMTCLGSLALMDIELGISIRRRRHAGSPSMSMAMPLL